MSSNNPYFDDNDNPKILNSFCAHIDMLGYSYEIIEAYKRNSERVLLNRFNAALQDAVSFLESKRERQGEKTDMIVPVATEYVKIFTDNILIGKPLNDKSDGESELGRLIIEISMYQLNLAIEGFFTRGAMALGPLHMSNKVAYGLALIEAHRLEREIAIYPRIILSDNVMKLVKKYIKYYSEPEGAPQYWWILIDFDGQPFINYLKASIPGGIVYWDLLEKHKNQITMNLKRFKNNPTIWLKYTWLARYHNFFCNLFSEDDDFNQEILIKKSLFPMSPKFQELASG